MAPPPDETTEQHKALLGVADGLDDMREFVAVMVAGFVADGFTDREAREIVTSFWRGMNRDNTDTEEQP